MPITWYVTEPDDELGRAVAAWNGDDAPEENLEVFAMILDTAKSQVLAYAPTPPLDADWEAAPPPRFVLAQLQQAINLWNAGRATPDVGADGWSFQPRPLDKTIRTIIRPIDGKPDVL